MDKEELFEKMEEYSELISKDTLLHMLFDYFNVDDLRGFLDHIKSEIGEIG